MCLLLGFAPDALFHHVSGIGWTGIRKFAGAGSSLQGAAVECARELLSEQLAERLRNLIVTDELPISGRI
jgi:hypothetical protein